MSWMIPAAMLGAAGISAFAGRKSSQWGGSQGKYKKIETLSNRQKSALHDILNHPERRFDFASQQPLYTSGVQYLQNILGQNPEAMKQFEAPAMRQFNEQIVPQLSERFSGLGAGSSSAFNQTMGQAATGLSERLAALRANLGMQALPMASMYAQMPFEEQFKTLSLGMGTPAFGYYGQPGSQGFGQGLAGSLAQGGSNALSMLAMMKMFGG
jgi:hypothetical protein